MKDNYKILLVKRLNNAFYDGFIGEISSVKDSWDLLWERSLELDKAKIIWSESSIIKVSEESTILRYSKDD